jgi:hypothetical protein
MILILVSKTDQQIRKDGVRCVVSFIVFCREFELKRFKIKIGKKAVAAATTKHNKETKARGKSREV